MSGLQTDSLSAGSWRFSRTKLYGWLTGVTIMIFGGVLCSVALGLLVGVPAVAFGLFLAITFAIAMAGAPMRTPVVLLLFTAGLALAVVGRVLAPVAAIFASYEQGRTLDRLPSIPNVLGLPTLLLGISLVGLATQWFRTDPTAGRLRRGAGLTFIHTGSVILLLGALATTTADRVAVQPWWAWLAVPLLLGLGTLLRVGRRGWSWLVVTVLSAIALPACWALLVARPA